MDTHKPHWARLTPKGVAVARLLLIGVSGQKAMYLADKRFDCQGNPNNQWVVLWSVYLKWRLNIRRFFGIADE